MRYRYQRLRGSFDVALRNGDPDANKTRFIGCKEANHLIVCTIKSTASFHYPPVET